MAASSSVETNYQPLQPGVESRDREASSLSNRWVVEVVAALPQVGMTVFPCQHAIPLGHIFSEIQRRIGFLSAIEGIKRQVEELPLARRSRQPIDFNQAVRDCTNQPILCYCQERITDFRPIVPKHLTEQGSDHPAARLERERAAAARPELEHADESMRTTPIDEVALAKAIMLLEQLKKLIDHFNGANKMSEHDLQRTLKYVYDRAIKPHSELSSTVVELHDPTLALVAEPEVEVVVEQNEQGPEQGPNDPEHAALVPERNAPPPFDPNHPCLQIGDGLTCNLYPLCQPDGRTRLNVYSTSALLLFMLGGIIFILFYPAIFGDVRLEDSSSAMMNSTLAE
jgi:hypothetical protein